MWAQERASDINGHRLFELVRDFAIPPEEAREYVRSLGRKAVAEHPGATAREVQDLVAEMIVSRYTFQASTLSMLGALPGAVPGVGTAITILSLPGQALVSLKQQLDMCMCLAAAFEHDLCAEETRQVVGLLAIGAIAAHGVKLAAPFAGQVATAAIREGLGGAASQAAREASSKTAMVVASDALDALVPQGIGVVLSFGTTYASSRAIGRKAIEWFRIDREQPGVRDPRFATSCLEEGVSNREE